MDEIPPVVERLPVVLLQGRAAILQLHEHDRFPDEIGEGGAALIGLGHAHFERGDGRLQAVGPAEGLEEGVEEGLGLALFIAGEVLVAPADKLAGVFLA